MAALDFPEGPSAGTEYVDPNGELWTYDGQAWQYSHMYGTREWDHPGYVIIGNKNNEGLMAFGMLDYLNGAFGGYAAFYGRTFPSYSGYFVLTANGYVGSPTGDTLQISDLVGRPDGTLQWNGYDIYHEGNPPPGGTGGSPSPSENTAAYFLLMGA